MIDAKRTEMNGRNLLVLDAGDPFQGSLFYTTYKGAAEAEFMKPSVMTSWRWATTNSMMARQGSKPLSTR